MFGRHELGVVVGGTYRHEERRKSYGWDDLSDSLNVQYLWGPRGYTVPVAFCCWQDKHENCNKKG
ncbi:hypothetical protein GCM10011418_16600 [Sphingobacterium alkalisoli]|nr:hypothetical protein GCM10011418_16600 [Sphingobacterium alkalisoli]